MRKQLQGIALILVGILLMVLSLVDPWIPIIGNIGRVLLPLLALAAGVIGLILTFKRSDDK